MSKYDNLEYKTFSEKSNKGVPKCVKKAANEDDDTVPEELIGLTFQNFKDLFHITNNEENIKFDFANNNQTLINENYFKAGNFFKNNMTPDEKREFVLDFLNFNYGNEINGKYFELYLQDIFNLKKYNFNDEDFSKIIKYTFGKDTLNLEDPEDRKLFKQKMFEQEIKFMDDDEANEWLEKQIDDEESKSKSQSKSQSKNINISKSESKSNIIET